MPAPARTPPSAHALRVADLSTAQPTAFDITPDAAARAGLAEALELLGLKKLRFTGDVRPFGKQDWRLEGALGATVVQPCAVTLAPVTTRIDEPVERTFLRDYDEPDTPETEMPEDDTTERLGTWIDLEAVMTEALSLALPMFPRSADAEAQTTSFAAPGVAPMTDDDARPFAGLAALRDKLGKDGDDAD